MILSVFVSLATLFLTFHLIPLFEGIYRDLLGDQRLLAITTWVLHGRLVYMSIAAFWPAMAVWEFWQRTRWFGGALLTVTAVEVLVTVVALLLPFVGAISKFIVALPVNIVAGEKGLPPPRLMPSQLPAAKCSEATVLVQHVYLHEACPPHEIELVSEGSRGVLLLDIGKDAVPVGFSADLDEICAVTIPHHLRRRATFVGDEISHPERTARRQQSEDLLIRRLPFGIIPQMMQDRGRKDDVIPARRQIGFAKIGLQGPHADGTLGPDSLGGAIEHGTAQIQKIALYAVERATRRAKALQ